MPLNSRRKINPKYNKCAFLFVSSIINREGSRRISVTFSVYHQSVEKSVLFLFELKLASIYISLSLAPFSLQS